MLGTFRAIMFVFLELLTDVARHGYVEGAVMIIPFEAYPTIEFSISIFGELIFFFDRRDEVVYVLLTRVFHPKIIHSKGKCDGLCGMFPQAGGLFAFIITMGGKAFLQEFVCQYTSLGEAPNCPSHFQVYVSIVHLVCEVVLFGNPWGKQGKRHAHVFVSIEGGQKVEIFDVEAHIFCVGCTENAVPV